MPKNFASSNLILHNNLGVGLGKENCIMENNRWLFL